MSVALYPQKRRNSPGLARSVMGAREMATATGNHYALFCALSRLETIPNRSIEGLCESHVLARKISEMANHHIQ